MQEQPITIINKLGLHARAAMALIKTTERYQSRITLRVNNREIDAKDIMQVMVLGAGCGTELDVITEGDDEVEALKAVTALINDRFGEAE